MERTLVLVKPDAVHRGLVGRILGRFEDKGLRLAGLKVLKMSERLAAQHYAPHRGKPFYEGLVRYITSTPLVAAVLEGPRAVEVARTLMGATFGWEARPGTIRGDLGLSSGFNLVHGSDSAESASREIALFFRAGELQSYPRAVDAWIAAEDDS